MICGYHGHCLADACRQAQRCQLERTRKALENTPRCHFCKRPAGPDYLCARCRDLAGWAQVRGPA